MPLPVSLSTVPARVLGAGMVVLLAVVPACGDDSTTPPPPPPGADEVVTGTDAFVFEPDEFRAEQGDRIGLVCEGSLPHNLVVETPSEDVLVVECGGREAAVGDLAVEPGTYTFFCDIPGHREAGMEGSVTVG